VSSIAVKLSRRGRKKMPGVFMAWTGAGGDQRLFLASGSSDGSPDVNFDGGQHRGDLNSSQGPALTVFNGKMFMAWKGSGGDQRLFLASGPVSAGGTDLSKFGGPLNRSDQNTGRGPALAVFKGRLFMAWAGVEGDKRLFLANSPDGDEFAGHMEFPQQFNTTQKPALAVFNNRLFMAWRSEPAPGHPDVGLLQWTSSPDGVNFDPPLNRGDFNSSQGPALTGFNRQLFMAWKGAGTDVGLFLASSSDGKSFADKQQRPEQKTSQGPALAVVNNRMSMAWTSADSQNLQWASTPDGNDWDGPFHRDAFNSSQGPALTTF
jgi:hypothetical protein